MASSTWNRPTANGFVLKTRTEVGLFGKQKPFSLFVFHGLSDLLFHFDFVIFCIFLYGIHVKLLSTSKFDTYFESTSRGRSFRSGWSLVRHQDCQGTVPEGAMDLWSRRWEWHVLHADLGRILQATRDDKPTTGLEVFEWLIAKRILGLVLNNFGTESKFAMAWEPKH